jgi:hypothetical protein
MASTFFGGGDGDDSVSSLQYLCGGAPALPAYETAVEQVFFGLKIRCFFWM